MLIFFSWQGFPLIIWETLALTAVCTCTHWRKSPGCNEQIPASVNQCEPSPVWVPGDHQQSGRGTGYTQVPQSNHVVSSQEGGRQADQPRWRPTSISGHLRPCLYSLLMKNILRRKLKEKMESDFLNRKGETFNCSKRSGGMQQDRIWR